MPCHATPRNIVLALLLALAGAALATRAVHAEEATVTAYPDMYQPSPSDRPMRKYSLELKPLPMLVLLVPGSVGISGEFEAKLTRNVSIFANAYHLDMRMSNHDVTNAQRNQSSTDAVAAETESDGLAAGLRYYGNAVDDSWYIGGQLGGDASHTEWAYGNERLADDRFAYTSNLEIGYRWLWSSGFLVRAGIGWAALDTRQREVGDLASAVAGSTDDAHRNVVGKGPDLATTFGTELDVGLGYAF